MPGLDAAQRVGQRRAGLERLQRRELAGVLAQPARGGLQQRAAGVGAVAPRPRALGGAGGDDRVDGPRAHHRRGSWPICIAGGGIETASSGTRLVDAESRAPCRTRTRPAGARTLVESRFTTSQFRRFSCVARCDEDSGARRPRVMTNERTQAYGRVVQTLTRAGARQSSCPPSRLAFATPQTCLIFAADLDEARRRIARHERPRRAPAVASGRWLEERVDTAGRGPAGLRSHRNVPAPQSLETSRERAARRRRRTRSLRAATPSDPPRSMPTAASRGRCCARSLAIAGRAAGSSRTGAASAC